VDQGFDVGAVATNRATCGGAAFARERGIPLAELSQKSFASAQERDVAMRDFFRRHGVELVVDAGYDRIHTQPFLDAFEGRIINIHPSLLPSFGGKGMFGHHVHQAVIDAECKVSGCTVHFVDATYDTGPIILQRACPVLDTDTADDLAARVFE
jgi:phosphoribosylglycinamide formyltransferase-1